MTTAAPQDWIKEFGLDGRKPPEFFSSVDQLDDLAGRVPQPHALRRAFEELGVQGVLCQERSPVIYFRQVKKIEPDRILELHKSFWNQGIAPILVVIAPDEVHVYSGLSTPEDSPTDNGEVPGLVEKLVRVQNGLRSFLLSVESGEYFHVHRRSFDPRQRVDRELLRNLQATRQRLGEVEAALLEPQTLDALLCRLVFTCYLFDRGVIDQAYLKSLRIRGANHLKDVLATKPRTAAKSELYTLFEKLGEDFNGDLFSADLESESKQVKVDHLEILDRFFHGTDVHSGQQSFWPYDFRFIPIETISAIYEHFLKAAGEEQKREAGAFYTPRFLAEFVLDVALEGEMSLLDKRFLDPACGSGIFLVGLFNRLAEEWKLKNPGARYDRRATGLMDILRSNLYGVDSNRSACQITAFSLYLAFLDQLSPPDIQKLLGKWERLPYLVFDPSETEKDSSVAGTIRYADFFSDGAALPKKAHLIVGNPPWGSSKDRNAPAVQWVAERNLPHPDRQIANAFMWKASEHLESGGRVCFVLPHGTLFNHSDVAVRFQQSFFREHAVDRVINLTDFRMFLFADSKAGSLVMRYGKEKPSDSAHIIDYLAPKTDWAVTQAEIMRIAPQDRSRLTVREVLDGLQGDDGPVVWKERFWASPRERQLLDRLSLMPRLRDTVCQPGRGPAKRWLIAEGFQPFGENDPESSKKTLNLPTDAFIQASYPHIDLFILPGDCESLGSNQVETRRLIRNTSIFEAPHVLVTKGFSRIAFADFDVTFRHALRGIHGPKADRDLLLFLAAYLRSDIARFYQFHTSSSWGVYRPEIHVEELLRLPFPMPSDTHNPKRCELIVKEVAIAVTKAMGEASGELVDREGIVDRTQNSINKLIEEYFDIDDVERMLVSDTTRFIIPSVQPSRSKHNIPTLKQSSQAFRNSYAKLLCDRLNGWAKQEYRVHARTLADSSIGVGMVVLEKTKRDEQPKHFASLDGELLKVIDGLQRTAAKKHGTFEMVRGLKVFWKNLLYITKPLGQRFWTNTAALNDADEIAATILTRLEREGS